MIVDHSGCASKAVDIHGAAGVEWLDRLPAILAGCAERWSLSVLPPFADLSYNYVAPAIRDDGTPVVLKAGVPHPELWRELEALRCFDGHGVVRLLDADREQGVLLLERLLPGTPLDDLDDDQQVTDLAVAVMRRLWRPVPDPHSFATVTGWAQGLARLRATFGGGYGPFPPALVDRAEGLFRELLSAPGEPVLLHGDLHPQNILRADREPWLAIDPKGVVGDPLYDAATFLGGLSRWRAGPDPLGTVERQLGHLADALGFDRVQLLGWALAQAVLSGWWSYEDHGRGWERAFALAERYASL